MAAGAAGVFRSPERSWIRRLGPRVFQNVSKWRHFCHFGPKARAGQWSQTHQLPEKLGSGSAPGCGKVWPPPASTWSHSFRGVLREVLSRLPQEAFDKVEAEVIFVLEERSLKMLSANALAPSMSSSRRSLAA